jgi:hypothetical protein
MAFLHTIRVALIIFLAGIALASCITDTPKQGGSFLLSPNDIAKQVGSYYGDSHPQVRYVISDHADPPPHDPMYSITLVGHFQKNAMAAQTLYFSALANKMYVWDIYAYNQQGQEVWMDKELPLR